jgi:cytoplasmic iron level regulating protein YaaA (DUF328/UPF0246 family)
MLTVLSPAKTLDFETLPKTKTASQPVLLDQSEILVDQLRGMTGAKLSKLMGISDKLGELNRERFGQWETPFTKTNSKQAVLAFKGDVYRGLDAESFSEDDFKFAQQHLRILSGLYGVLRPLDLIQPYRLEMGTKLKNDRGANLYDFWGDRITDALNKQLGTLKSSTLVNLASVEYFTSVNEGNLTADVVAPTFLDEKNGKYKIISFYAKKARGLMAAWIVQKRIDDAKKLRAFKVAGYRYSAHLSSPGKPAFIRDEAT